MSNPHTQPLYYPYANDVLKVLVPQAVTIVFGTMSSGKTEFLVECHKQATSETSMVIFSPERDTRSDSNEIVSKNGKVAPAFKVSTLEPTLVSPAFNSAKIVAVDESHMFQPDDIYRFVIKARAARKIVIISILNNSFSGRPFPHLGRLMGLADRAVRVVGPCDVEGCARESQHHEFHRAPIELDRQEASSEEYYVPAQELFKDSDHGVIVEGSTKSEHYYSRCFDHWSGKNEVAYTDY